MKRFLASRKSKGFDPGTTLYTDRVILHNFFGRLGIDNPVEDVPRLAGEAMQALGAAVDLRGPQAVSAFAFPGGILPSALQADGIWIDDGGGWH